MIELAQLTKDNILMICPNSYKEKLLESLNNEKKILDISFLTLEEYKKNYYFDYGVDAIKYLIDNKNISPENAKEILENIVYVEDKKYDNEKLDKLVEYRNELNNKELLIYNPIFKKYLSSKNVVVVGYGKLSKQDKKIIEGKTVEILEFPIQPKKYEIVEFDTVEEEIEHLYNSISDLLKKKINIDNIFVLNATSDYDSFFKRYNSYYNFVIELNNNVSIFGTKLVKDFIEQLETKTRTEIYNNLVSINNEISTKLIDILNKYVGYEPKEVKELIINDLKSVKVSNVYKNVVKLADVFDKFDTNDYVFLLSFNDKFPHTKKDTDYINDSIKSYVDLPLVEEENELLKNNVKAYLSNIDNLYVSYSKSSPFNTYNKQTLLLENEYSYKTVKLSYEYSEKLNRTKYSKELDSYRKFDEKSEDIDKLYKAYKKNNYFDYDNRYKKLTAEQIKKITNQIASNSHNKKANPDELTLSYSSMNGFFECQFKYYLDSVLAIKEPFGTYYTRLGNVCHGVLEDLYTDPNYEFESSWKKQIDKLQNGNSEPVFSGANEEYFVSRIKEELKQDIKIVQAQKANSILDKQSCESRYTFAVDNKINFTGYIDKVMYKENEDHYLASVVDYKTGDTKIDRSIMKHGLSLQLPSYLFLMKYADNFDKEIKFIGFYIQNIINTNRKYEDGKTLDDLKFESMKLNGISSISPKRVSALDLTLEPGVGSSTIQGLSINKKDGNIKKSSKIYDDQGFEELINLVEEKVKEAGHAILSGEFNINPKQIGKDNKSCGYCKYAPICYKRARDLVRLEKEEQ